jgi:hypothetical protein
MYSIGNFTALISEEQNFLKDKIGENKSMKILIRMLVLTVITSAAAVSQSGAFAGPGVPVPPTTLTTVG